MIFDVFTFAKSWYYRDTATLEQTMVRELSALHDKNYYLAQSPSECAHNDSPVYRLINNENSYDYLRIKGLPLA
ncbi:MAG: hypothetical protein IRD7MM_02285 [Candidatus Midichloria mitochondrii]